jgi:hypothetical protein
MVKTLHLADKESRCFPAVQAFDLTQNLDMSVATARFPGKNCGKLPAAADCSAPYQCGVLPAPSENTRQKRTAKSSCAGKKKPSSKM